MAIEERGNATWNTTGDRRWAGGVVRRLEWVDVLIASAVTLALATAITFGLSALLFSIVGNEGAMLESEGGPPLIASYLGVFLAFAIGGILLRRLTHSDPIAHALAMLAVAAAVLGILSIIDLSTGLVIEGWVDAGSGGRLKSDTPLAQFIIGPWWTLPAVALPAAIVGSVIVPPRGEHLDEDPLQPNTDRGL